MYEDDNKEVLDESELLKDGFIIDDEVGAEDDILDGSIRDEDDELLGEEEEAELI